MVEVVHTAVNYVLVPVIVTVWKIKMTFRPVPRYEEHLWYPILVKFPGCGSRYIIEMQGKEVNEWNDMVRNQQEQDTANSKKGWCV